MYLGLDLGTSGLKGLLIDERQKIIAEANAPLTVSRLHEGWSEQNPDEWVRAVQNILDALAAQTSLAGLQAIGLSGQMHGATLLDNKGAVLRPCILWNDTRSHEQAALLDADPIFRDLSGNIVFAGFTAPKLAWVRQHEPRIFGKIAKVLLPKDYLRFWLIGEYVSEMSDAAGTSWLDTGQRDWSDVLLAKTGLERAHMPRLVEGSAVSGQLRQSLCDRYGIVGPVFVAGGGGDNAASALGVGVAKAGDAFISLGTSGVLFAACDTYAPNAASAVHSFCHALPNKWHQMGVILSATDSLNWYANLMGQSAHNLTKELGPLSAPSKTLFLPYLGGERTPHNNANVRGGFLGLEHQSNRQAGTRAVLEGVVHAFRDNWDALAATGTKIERVMAVGGGSKSRYWLEALATSLNISIDVPVAGDFGGALGAARLAMLASGYDESIIQRPQLADRVEPNKALLAAFNDAHHRYRHAYTLIKELD